MISLALRGLELYCVDGIIIQRTSMCQDGRKKKTHRDYRTSVSERQTINRHRVCGPDAYSVWDRVTGVRCY